MATIRNMAMADMPTMPKTASIPASESWASKPSVRRRKRNGRKPATAALTSVPLVCQTRIFRQRKPAR